MSRLPAALLVPLILASGCASDFERRFERWQGYTNGNGPYSRWARCIDERSGYYLNFAPDRAPDAPDPDSPRGQLFTYVLADCREFMSDIDWSTLQDKQARRLIGDAWQAFIDVRNEIRMRMDESII